MNLQQEMISHEIFKFEQNIGSIHVMVWYDIHNTRVNYQDVNNTAHRFHMYVNILQRVKWKVQQLELDSTIRKGLQILNCFISKVTEIEVGCVKWYSTLSLGCTYGDRKNI